MDLYFKGVLQKVHSSWESFLSTEICELLTAIENQIGEDFTPAADKVLRFLEFDLTKAKVVIIGQDPYPQPGTATGRCFEVGDINTWDELKRNTSLQNILKLIYKSAMGLRFAPSLHEVRTSTELTIAPPPELFSSWERQGVLLLNASLTCQLNNPNSHKRIWKSFSKKLIQYIDQKAPDVKWFLWGNNAKTHCWSVLDSKKLICSHPRINSQQEGDFLASKHFAIDLGIDWTGNKVK